MVETVTPDPTAEQQQERAPSPAANRVAKVTKIPSLNPYIAPNMICPNRLCLQPMTPKVSTAKGGEPELQYDCEPCNYSFFASLVHAQGLCKQLGSRKEGPPEVMQKGR